VPLTLIAEVHKLSMHIVLHGKKWVHLNKTYHKLYKGKLCVHIT